SKAEHGKQSLRKIYQEVQAEWRDKLRDNSMTVSHDTVTRRLQGGQSHQEANSENFAWLSKEEEENMVIYLLKLANHGFSLNHRTLKLHVDNIL
ncbi:hypothetical protein EV363DRAFT_1158821, partial [Boletus edulis]